jgi:hypothetical protein
MSTVKGSTCCQWLTDRKERFYATPWGQHFRNARKEFLLGVRALIDRKIECVDSLGRSAEVHKVEVE